MIWPRAGARALLRGGYVDRDSGGAGMVVGTDAGRPWLLVMLSR